MSSASQTTDHPALTRPAPERRVLLRRVELRAAAEGSDSPGTIFGYAARFLEPSQDLGGFVEVLQPGCFRGCMGDDVRCLRNHLDDHLLGRSMAGTLRFEEDGEGLHYECDLPNTGLGRDTAVSIRRGDFSGNSFQFTIPIGGDSWDFNGPVPVRLITKVGRLYDVGPCTFPAYETTTLECRSLAAARAAHEADLAARIRESLSRARARQWLAEAQLL